MREIKFRAWDGERMIYSLSGMHCDFDLCNPCSFGLENLELMQYTGIKDKNSKEIYEGDIIKEIIENSKCPPIKQVIRICPDITEFNFYSFLDSEFVDERKTIEVIGNIYENPELLA